MISDFLTHDVLSPRNFNLQFHLRRSSDFVVSFPHLPLPLNVFRVSILGASARFPDTGNYCLPMSAAVLFMLTLIGLRHCWGYRGCGCRCWNCRAWCTVVSCNETARCEHKKNERRRRSSFILRRLCYRSTSRLY